MNTTSSSTWSQEGAVIAAERTVADIMSTDLLSCDPDTPVVDAARRMSAARRSSIIVREGGRAIGIWTEHDVLGARFEGAGADQRPIRQVMNAPVLTLAATTSIGEAALQFKQRGIRHFLVIDSAGCPVGLVSQTDVVLNHGVEWFMRMQSVGSVLAEPPPVLAADCVLADATERMRAEHRDAVVIDTGEGDFAILTERDILRHLGNGGGATRCLDVASRPMQIVTAGDSLFRARNLMIERSFRHLGVADPNGALIGMIGFGDIMQTIEHGYVEELELALRERDAELKASEGRYRALVESSPDAIAVHRQGRILFINPAGTELFGARGPAQIVGSDFSRFLEDGELEDGDLENGDTEDVRNRLEMLEREARSHAIEERFVRLDGSAFDVELRGMPITYNGESAWQIVMRDISRRKQVESELRRLASTDQLTGIHNRPHFEQHLDHELREAERYVQPLGLIMFDLNGFKQVNDRDGHDAGDDTLCRITAAITAVLRDTDVFARWGGDEFMILTPRTGVEGALHLCHKLAAALAATESSAAGPVGAAFAVTQYRPGESRRDLLKRLDAGTYEAKALDHDGFSGIARV